MDEEEAAQPTSRIVQVLGQGRALEQAHGGLWNMLKMIQD